MLQDFESLYRDNVRDLHRFSLFLSGDPARADDLVSETFVRLWGARDRVDLRTVRGYLFTIARNLHLQELRRRRPSVALDAIDFELADARPGPEVVASDRAELRATLEALQVLPETDRAALLMHVDGGLGYDEIAAALSISAGTARVKVHRARLKLATARRGPNFDRKTSQETPP